MLFDVNGKEITELTAQEREACVQMLATLMEKYAADYLVGGAGKAELPGTIKSIAAALREIGSDEQLVAGFQAAGMSASFIRDLTLQLALGDEAYADFREKLKPLEIAGELTKQAAERAIEQIAEKYGLSAQETKDLKLVTGVTTATIIGAIGAKNGFSGKFSGRYEPNSKHDANRPGVSPQPTNQQNTLANSVPTGANSPARIAYDASTGEIVVFRSHGDGVYHGYAKNWNDATQQERNALVRAGWFKPNGRPVK